jgi:hypothetical protein
MGNLRVFADFPFFCLWAILKLGSALSQMSGRTGGGDSSVLRQPTAELPGERGDVTDDDADLRLLALSGLKTSVKCGSCV